MCSILCLYNIKLVYCKKIEIEVGQKVQKIQQKTVYMNRKKSYIISKISEKQNNQSCADIIVYIFSSIGQQFIVLDRQQYQIEYCAQSCQKMLISKPNKQPPVGTPDFIRKLYNMIQRYPDTISFSEDGSQVLIHNQHKFQGEILPVFFRHSNWRSFVRQMNMYSFRKINRVNQTYIFINNYFKRGNEAQFDKIKRKINTKDQQLQNQRDIQAEVKAMVTQQCLNLGIPTNINLQNSLNNLNSCSQDKNKYAGSCITMPSVIISNIKNQTPHVVNIKQQCPENNNGNILQSQSQNYINSVTYFLSNVINFRHETQKLLTQLKGSIENVAKQRKQVDNKNLLSTFKDSVQLIQQMSEKMKQKIQSYVNNEDEDDEKIKDSDKPSYQIIVDKSKLQVDNRNIMDLKRKPIIPLIKNNSNSVVNVSSSSFGSQMEGKQCKKAQVQTVMPSFNSSSSINVIITQAPTNSMPSSLSKSQQLKKQQVKKQQQFPQFNPFLPKQQYDKQMNIHNSINMNNNANINNNIINKVNTNLLGLSSLCSFSSVTHLLNFDKQ